MDIGRLLKLRRAVDVLYDIQDVRLRTANRLRQFPEKSQTLYVEPLEQIEKEITNQIGGILTLVPIWHWLDDVRGIGPRIAGGLISKIAVRFERVDKEAYNRYVDAFSHAEDETHSRDASHDVDETQRNIASQISTETHNSDASQPMRETQSLTASQVPGETHTSIASHKKSETQASAASQVTSETHEKVASQECLETHASPASQTQIETHTTSAYTRQQIELAVKTEDGDYLVPTERGISSFGTVSQLWAFCGMHTVDGHAPRRKRGEQVNWSPAMRTLCYKIGEQFVRQGDIYRQYYDVYKARKTQENESRDEPRSKGHIHNMSKRYAVKRFLADFWEQWRRMEGLPVREPYVIGQLGHEKITPLQSAAEMSLHAEGED